MNIARTRPSLPLHLTRFGFMGLLECKGHPRINELSIFRVRQEVGAWEEDAVADGERHIAGDLPVQVDVGLDAEVMVIYRAFIKRTVPLKLVEQEEIRAD